MNEMPFTKGDAAEFGRQGGRSTAAKYGREHMARIGRLGFAALAKRLGYAGGSRRVALIRLLRAGRLRDLGPDPTEAHEWADRVLEGLDPEAPEVPY
jgi:general stress protein YciG